MMSLRRLQKLLEPIHFRDVSVAELAVFLCSVSFSLLAGGFANLCHSGVNCGLQAMLSVINDIYYLGIIALFLWIASIIVGLKQYFFPCLDWDTGLEMDSQNLPLYVSIVTV